MRSAARVRRRSGYHGEESDDQSVAVLERIDLADAVGFVSLVHEFIPERIEPVAGHQMQTWAVFGCARAAMRFAMGSNHDQSAPGHM